MNPTRNHFITAMPHSYTWEKTTVRTRVVFSTSPSPSAPSDGLFPLLVRSVTPPFIIFPSLFPLTCSNFHVTIRTPSIHPIPKCHPIPVKSVMTPETTQKIQKLSETVHELLSAPKLKNVVLKIADTNVVGRKSSEAKLIFRMLSLSARAAVAMSTWLRASCWATRLNASWISFVRRSLLDEARKRRLWMPCRKKRRRRAVSLWRLLTGRLFPLVDWVEYKDEEDTWSCSERISARVCIANSSVSETWMACLATSWNR